MDIFTALIGPDHPPTWLERFLGVGGNAYERAYTRQCWRAAFMIFLLALIGAVGTYWLHRSWLEAAVAGGFVCVACFLAWRSGRRFHDRLHC